MVAAHDGGCRERFRVFIRACLGQLGLIRANWGLFPPNELQNDSNWPERILAMNLAARSFCPMSHWLPLFSSDFPILEAILAAG